MEPDTKLDLKEQTFVDTVLKIIGPKIVAEFIERAWELLSDDQKQEVAIVIGNNVTKQIKSDSDWKFRHIVEHKIDEIARKTAGELVAANYDEILNRVHQNLKNVVEKQIIQTCNEVLKNALQAVGERMKRDLTDVTHRVS